MGDPSSIEERHADLFADGGEEARFRDPLAARRKAMDYLARREYGRAELTRKLSDAGFAAAVAAAAVDRLADEGLQDDRRFVDAFVRSRIAQGKGPLRIRADLAGRGLDEPLIEAALEDAGADWAALAADVRRRKFGAALPETFPEKARQMRFLQYRGFLPDQVQAALDAAR